MRFSAFLWPCILILTACAAPATARPDAQLLDVQPTLVSVEPAAATGGTFESSLLATQWMGKSKGNLLFPLDPASGTALPGYAPISLGQSYSHAFSPDRTTLAVVTFPNDNTYNGSLMLIDVPNWTTETFELKTVGWVTSMVFSPDAKQLAIAQGETNYMLTVFDLEKNIFTAQSKEDSYITRLKFTADGESLMMYGITIENPYTESESGGAPQVRLLDSSNLSPRWSAELEGVRDGMYPTDEDVPVDYSQPGTAMYLSPALAFAPKQDALYVVHADSDQLTIVDFSDQTIATVEIWDQLNWFEQLLSLTAGVAHAKVADGASKQAVISPDGQFLYVVGVHNESIQDSANWQMSQTPLGLEIIQISDGSRVEHIETDSAELSLLPDGRLLYLHHWGDGYTKPWTEVFDTATRQIIISKSGVFASPALRVNGESLLVSTYSLSENSHRMGIFQPDDLKALIEWTDSDYIAWLTP